MTDHDPVVEAARADFCRFVAACYYEPVEAFAEEKLFDSMAQAASHFDTELAAGAGRLGQAFGSESLGNLLIDYTRLFLGPVDAPARPYGSIWMEPDQLTMQDSTMAVLALYEEGGFDIAEDFRELPDHIAAELEFLYLLLFRESRGQGNDAAGAAGDPAFLRKRLIAEHLERWAGPFTEAVRAHAQCAFYRELGELTNRFVTMEARRAQG
jgi:TorA maturation chaperone TorD